MWLVTRYIAGAGRGYKFFASKEEAEAWLETEDVEEDMDYGCRFTLEEVPD